MKTNFINLFFLFLILVLSSFHNIQIRSISLTCSNIKKEVSNDTIDDGINEDINNNTESPSLLLNYDLNSTEYNSSLNTNNNAIHEDKGKQEAVSWNGNHIIWKNNKIYDDYNKYLNSLYDNSNYDNDNNEIKVNHTYNSNNATDTIHNTNETNNNTDISNHSNDTYDISQNSKYNIRNVNEFSFCSTKNKICYSEGLILLITNIPDNQYKNKLKLRKNKDSSISNNKINNTSALSNSYLKESYGLIRCNNSLFSNSTIKEQPNTHEACLTASEGNYFYSSDYNNTIPISPYDKVCRLSNETNYLSEIILIKSFESVTCTSELFTISKLNDPVNNVINTNTDSIVVYNKINMNLTNNSTNTTLISDKNKELGCSCAKIYKSNWKYCSKENDVCDTPGIIRYGYNTSYVYKAMEKSFICDSTTIGQPVNSKGNYCWYLRETNENTYYYNYNSKLMYTEEYQACSIIINGVPNSVLIFSPFNQVACTTQDFNTSPIANLNTTIVICKCLVFIS